MNEDLENARASATKEILEALTEIVKDKSKQTGERLEAGSLVRGVCQDLILSDLSSKGLDQDSSFKRRLLNSADKLDEQRES